MLALAICLLYWIHTQVFSVHGCRGPAVSIPNGETSQQLSVGESFKLSCEFTCVSAQHFIQVWMYSSSKGGLPLVNITSSSVNVSLVLIIRSATKEDAGKYACKTQPPVAISPDINIKIADSLTTMESIQHINSSRQPSSAAGLQGQIWYWMLLGKTTILFLSLALLVAKCRKE